MQPVLDFLLQHGYWVLFLVVLAEQMAVPIPATPVLLAMGALAGLNKSSLPLSLLLATLACVLCDQLWYRLGRVRGHSILKLICKLSLEPDSCVSNMKAQFARWGAWSLLFAKFVPGLSAVAAPLSGLTRMPASKFLLMDTAGSVAWTGTYLCLGFVFRTQLEDLAQSLGRFGGWVVAGAALLAVIYFGAKLYERKRFLRSLHVDRVSPEELMSMLDRGEAITIVDLRDALELEMEGVKIPGARWIAMAAMEAHQDEIPRGQEAVLYCS